LIIGTEDVEDVAVRIGAGSGNVLVAVFSVDVDDLGGIEDCLVGGGRFSTGAGKGGAGKLFGGEDKIVAVDEAVPWIWRVELNKLSGV
jgi:hypothetical protein